MASERAARDVAARRRLAVLAVVGAALIALAFGIDRSRQDPGEVTAGPAGPAPASEAPEPASREPAAGAGGVEDQSAVADDDPGFPEPPPLFDGLDPSTLAPTGEFTAVTDPAPRVGSGVLHTYAVHVEDGVPVDRDAFADEVHRILADPRGWTADGSVSLERIDPTSQGAPDFEVVLATPPTADSLCAPLETDGAFSCHQDGRVVINVLRWAQGADPAGLPLPRYREYLVSHEVGHALGHGHVGCPAPGAPAPVMMQQTKGIGSCSPNPWPFP